MRIIQNLILLSYRGFKLMLLLQDTLLDIEGFSIAFEEGQMKELP